MKPLFRGRHFARRWWITLATAGFLIGCRGDDPSGIEFGPAQPILGRELTPGTFPFRPTWSADSREIYFLALSGGSAVFRLDAVNVESDQRRPVTSIHGGNTGRNHVQASDDGRFVYFTVSDPSGALTEVLYRVPASGGTAVPVIDNLAWPWFTVSSDASRVAFVSSGSVGPPQNEWLAVTDGADGPTPTTRLLARTSASAPPFAFSPDETLLVVSKVITWLYGLRTVMLAFPDGRLQVVFDPPIDPLTQEIAGLDVHWLANAPHLLVARPSRSSREIELFDLDALSGFRTRIGSLLGGADVPGVLTWSRDGRKIAALVPIEAGPIPCSGEGACIDRPLIHWRLYLTSRDSQNSPQVLADVATTEGVSWLSFSPDGRWIGYLLQQKLYVHELS